MHLIAPDVLTEARGLTGAMAGTVCVVGIALWVFGWRWHRFWVVAGITLAAGLIGLTAGRGAGNNTPVMAIGVLLAITAGMMALELAKILAFVAGGVGAWLAVQWVLPQAQELWAVFLCGGLFGVLMYRLWTMMLTSLTGTLLAGHAGLLLLEPVLKFDAAAWAAANLSALNGLAVGFIVLGILVQAAASKDEEAKKDADEKKEEEDEEHDHDEKPKKKPGRKRFRLFGKAA
ncbi:MAG TPA: hypothetical protein VMZ71_06375 [Gemmataceae bacterium]|nr:hypothetical protein [Gemmataceae bacterium]